MQKNGHPMRIINFVCNTIVYIKTFVLCLLHISVQLTIIHAQYERDLNYRRAIYHSAKTNFK